MNRISHLFLCKLSKIDSETLKSGPQPLTLAPKKGTILLCLILVLTLDELFYDSLIGDTVREIWGEVVI